MFRIHIGGKFKFNKLKKEEQQKIISKLEKKSHGIGGRNLGIKIDGKQVSKDNIKDFEITKMEKIPKLVKPKVEKIKAENPKVEKRKETKSKLTKKELEDKADKMSFTKFRKWAKKEYKVTGRSIEGIISDILAGKKEVD